MSTSPPRRGKKFLPKAPAAEPDPKMHPPKWADTSFRSLLEAAPDAMLVVNRAGEIVVANLQAQNLYGYSREHLIGKVVESLTPARLRDRHRQHRENFFANPETQAKQVLEIFAVRSDANEIPVDVSLSLLTIGSETFAISATRDATERRRIEELKRAEVVLRETRESEQRFRLIADTAPVLIWMSGADQLCTYFNKSWLDFTGRSIDSELGNGWAEGVHPEDLRRCMDTYTHAFDRREEFRMEYRLRRHDREYRWVLDIGAPRFNQDRSFVGYIGIGVDITERKQAEERLREYERVIQGLEERIMVVDREYRYVIANRAFLQYRGMEREQVVGHFVPEVVGREVFETVIRGKMDECFKGKVVQYELKYRYTNLGERDLFVSYFPIEGPTGVNRIAIVLQDVTERKRAEDAIRESEKRYRRIVETTNEGVWLLDSELHTSYVNRQMEEVLGYEPGEMVGRIVFDFYFPEDFEHKKQALKRRQQGVREQIEERLRRRDGSELWVRMSVSPLIKDNGEFDGALAMVSDITERKRAEEALARVSRKLIEAQEEERTRIGRELHDDIGQRLAMLAIELQQLHEDPPNLPDVRSRIGELHKQTLEIAADVQSLSHELHSAKLQYLGIAAAMRGFCQEFGDQQKVEIDFTSLDLPSPLSPDISLCLFRVLQEALHNAVKHSGVRHFEVRLWGTSDEIHLTVIDSGAGFDRESAKASRGLGLISMEERLKLLNGTLSIESRPKRGTTIHARVPLNSGSDSMRAVG